MQDKKSAATSASTITNYYTDYRERYQERKKWRHLILDLESVGKRRSGVPDQKKIYIFLASLFKSLISSMSLFSLLVRRAESDLPRDLILLPLLDFFCLLSSLRVLLRSVYAPFFFTYQFGLHARSDGGRLRALARVRFGGLGKTKS